MTPHIRIRLDGNGRTYWPGETVGGQYQIESVPLEDVKAIEVSILWYTEGKGDEDLNVHDFRRLAPEDEAWTDPRLPGRFSAVLPNSPLSYQGAIVKIRWCVRVRVFLGRGKEIVGEKPFQVGAVRAAKASIP